MQKKYCFNSEVQFNSKHLLAASPVFEINLPPSSLNELARQPNKLMVTFIKAFFGLLYSMAKRKKKNKQKVPGQPGKEEKKKHWSMHKPTSRNTTTTSARCPSFCLPNILVSGGISMNLNFQDPSSNRTIK